MDLYQATECGSVLSAEVGEITSPNFSAPYQPGVRM